MDGIRRIFPEKVLSDNFHSSHVAIRSSGYFRCFGRSHTYSVVFVWFSQGALVGFDLAVVLGIKQPLKTASDPIQVNECRKMKYEKCGGEMREEELQSGFSKEGELPPKRKQYTCMNEKCPDYGYPRKIERLTL